MIWEKDVKDSKTLIFSLNDRSDFLEILPELVDVSLDGEIEISNGKSADDVAHRSARQVDVHFMRAGDFLNLSNDLELCRG